MPLAERFYPGTLWVLTVGAHGFPAGTVVRVEGEIAPTTGIELCVPVSFPDHLVRDVSLDILG